MNALLLPVWLCRFVILNNVMCIRQNRVNSGYVILAIKIWSILWLLCTCPAYILTLLQIIILKTAEVAETRPLLCHVHKAIFLSKSRVCSSSDKSLIRVLWSLRTCPAYILTLLQVSNHYLENCRGCWDTNSTIKCKPPEGHMDGHTDGWTYT